MKKQIILALTFILSLLPSCSNQKSASSEIDDLLSNSHLPLETKIDSFMYDKTALNKVSEEDGCTVYKIYDCHTINDDMGSLFYFKNDVNVGFRTSNPESAFNILGFNIGCAAYSNLFDGSDGLVTTLLKRGWKYAPELSDSKHMPIKDEESSYLYKWVSLEYEHSSLLEINLAIETLNGTFAVGFFEMFLNK